MDFAFLWFLTHSGAHNVDFVKEGNNEAVEVPQIQNQHSVEAGTCLLVCKPSLVQSYIEMRL